MADIFISYSRRDSDEALHIAEKLRLAGAEVWIDQHGIEGATNWSKEIVQAIKTCKAFLILLSPNAITSSSVTRECSIASERGKIILPIELEPVELTDDLEYPLAGIQRLAAENFESILRALSKAGIDINVQNAVDRLAETPSGSLPEQTALAIMPFEDLSADRNNKWLSDGLAEELMTALGKVRPLRIASRSIILELTSAGAGMRSAARTLGIKYLVEGSIRVHDNAFRIAARLVEAEHGEQLWTDSFKGTLDDIFEIQERVAREILEGMKIVLLPNEENALTERETKSSEAYQLLLKGRECAYAGEEGHERAIEYAKQATEIDPNFAPAQASLAMLYNSTSTERRPDYRKLAMAHALKAVALKPEAAVTNLALGAVLHNQGNADRAFDLFLKALAIDPNSSGVHAWLGFYYRRKGEFPAAAKYYEKALELEPGQVHYILHLTGIYTAIHDQEKLKDLAMRSVAHLERHLRLFPGDRAHSFTYAQLLKCLGENEKAASIIEKFTASEGTTCDDLYDMACFFASPSPARAIEYLAKAVDLGWSDYKYALEDDDLNPLYEMPEFRKLLDRMKEKSEQSVH